MTSFQLAISPCPNDTFIFGAWINGYLNSNSIKLTKVLYRDIRELNLMAVSEHIDCIKVSAAQAVHLLDKYEILTVGAALGIDCGPLLISKKNISLSELTNANIAIPGLNTTANFLFDFAVKTPVTKHEIIFSEIENQLIHNKLDAGVIIHENRFTYQAKGLKLLLDLGQYWVDQQKLPIPLGLILIKRNLSQSTKSAVHQLITDSLEFAHQNLNIIMPFIKNHAQEMEESVCLEHIKLYVNNYSINLQEGKQAIIKLFELIKHSQYKDSDIFYNI